MFEYGTPEYYNNLINICEEENKIFKFALRGMALDGAIDDIIKLSTKIDKNNELIGFLKQQLANLETKPDLSTPYTKAEIDTFLNGKH